MDRQHGSLGRTEAGSNGLCGKYNLFFEDLVPLGRPVRFEFGQVIFREADACESVHLLCAGRVRLLASSREGRRMMLKIARPGEILGLSAALASHCHEMTAESVGVCRLRTVRTSVLLDFLARNPQANMATARILAQEYKAACQNLKRLTLPVSVPARVANLLLDWTQEHAPDPAIDADVLSLTHEEIALMTGTRRETVTRILTKFERDALISLSRAAIRVLQPKALEQFAI